MIDISLSDRQDKKQQSSLPAVKMGMLIVQITLPFGPLASSDPKLLDRSVVGTGTSPRRTLCFTGLSGKECYTFLKTAYESYSPLLKTKQMTMKHKVIQNPPWELCFVNCAKVDMPRTNALDGQSQTGTRSGGLRLQY